MTPIYGKLSDLYGRRRLLLVGIGVFAVGSLLCALAPDMLSLILARALQGVGGGGLIAPANTVVGDRRAAQRRASRLPLGLWGLNLMPMLLEDLVEETSAGNRRAADRLDAEAKELEQRRRTTVAVEELCQMAIESAQQATAFAIPLS